MSNPAYTLFTSKEFHMETLQNELFRQLEEYRLSRGFKTRKELADDLGYSKGYVTRLMAGEFNHSAQKLIELSLKIGKAPLFSFMDLSEFVSTQSQVEIISLPHYENRALKVA